MEKKNKLEKLLEDIRLYGAEGNRRKLTEVLREIMTSRRPYYHESIGQNLQDGYSDSLFKALILELDNEEEESIETAELAYVGICSVLKGEKESVPEHYKRRLLLLHYFSDFFTDALIDIFLAKYRENHMLEARQLAMECLQKMQWADMLYLEEHHPDYIDEDEQLEQVCNNLEIAEEASAADRGEALLLHKVLYAYLKTKYKN